LDEQAILIGAGLSGLVAGAYLARGGVKVELYEQSGQIGGIAGGDNTRLKTALLVLPAASLIMVVVNLILRPMLARAKA